ncbi:hypothetical protein NKG05_04885 [Oerskovia sp. M15]
MGAKVQDERDEQPGQQDLEAVEVGLVVATRTPVRRTFCDWVR